MPVITKQAVAEKMAAYLRHEIARAELVDWAENALLDGEFAEHDVNTLRSVIGRLGVADIRSFGLTWEDCDELLRELGYSARIEIVAP